VTAIALSPDGRFAAGGEFAGVGLLGDVGTAKELARVPRRRQGDEGQGRVHGQILARSREGGDVLLLSLPDLRWSRVQSHRRSVTGLVFLDKSHAGVELDRRLCGPLVHSDVVSVGPARTIIGELTTISHCRRTASPVRWTEAFRQDRVKS